ncbi:MAG: hypothetical protein ACXIVG_05295 [Pararhodobacter sp.]
MTKPRPPLFVDRTIYRRRRLMDAARLLPVVGLVLILLPVLWSRAGGQGIAAEAIYLFALWAFLVLIAAAMAGPLRRGAPQPGAPPRQTGQPEVAQHPQADQAAGPQGAAGTRAATTTPPDDAGKPVTDTPQQGHPAAPQTQQTPSAQDHDPTPAPPLPGGRA